MRKSLVIAALAASILSVPALAATADVGPIKAIDSTKHQLTLSDGKVFMLPSSFSASGFKVGDKVKVTYTMQNGKMVASEVSKTS
jgi:Cu/Ag efflux protein CusF